MKNQSTVLLIEDDRSLSSIVEKQLTKNNFNVSVADNVDDALKIIKSIKVDAIWLDHYLLGEKNGLDFVTELKKEGGIFSKIPIFVVSNTATEEKVKSYMHLGVDKYYVKAENSLTNIITNIKDYIAKGK